MLILLPKVFASVRRLDIIRALNPTPKESVQIYERLVKERFLNSSLLNNHLFPNLIPRVSSLQGSFDYNHDLLRGQHYWKSKRLADIKLSPDREFLIDFFPNSCFLTLGIP